MDGLFCGVCFIVALIFCVKMMSRMERVERLLSELLKNQKTPQPLPPTSTPPATVSQAPPPVSQVPVSQAPVLQAPPVSQAPVSQPVQAQSPIVPTTSSKEPPPLPSLPPTPPQSSPQPGAVVSKTSLDQTMEKALRWLLYGTVSEGKVDERQFASTWLLRAGVLSLLFMLGYLVSLGIQHGWLNEYARAIGCVVVGCALVGGGVKLLGGRFRALGESLAGVGLAAMFFSIFASASRWHIISSGWGYACTLVVVAGGVVLSVRKRAPSMSAIALLGGYMAPIFIQTDIPNLTMLVTYLFLLGLGAFAVACLTEWFSLTWISLAASYCHLIVCAQMGWGTNWKATLGLPSHWQVYFAGASLFFLLHTAVTVVRSLLRRHRTEALHVVQLLVNTFVFAWCLWNWMDKLYFPHKCFAWVTIGLAIVFVLHIVELVRQDRQDILLMNTCQALAAAALALTIPALLGSAWYAAAWSCLGLLLMVLGRRAGSRMMCLCAWCVQFLACFSILLALLNFSQGLFSSYGTLYPWYPWGERISRCLLPILFLAGTCLADNLPHNKSAPGFAKNDLSQLRHSTVVYLMQFGWVTMLFLYLSHEAVAVARAWKPVFESGAVSLLWSVFAAVMLWIGLRFHRAYLRFFGLGLFAVTVLKVFFHDLADVTTGFRVILTLVFGIVLLIASFWYLKRDPEEK